VSRLKQAIRKMVRSVEGDRLACLRCPGCGRRNVLARRKDGIASCTRCGHLVSSDLYQHRREA